jgi:aminoglycoside phosphotransferase (APT) family kinase protein
MLAAPVRLDETGAGWLAARDPALTELPAVVTEAARSGWTLHDVQWIPSQRCRLAYRRSAGGGTGSFVGVDITRSGRSAYDYRDDVALAGLPAVSDADAVADLLAPALGVPVLGCRVAPVRYRPGARCVLRYDLETARGSTSVYAKVLPPGGYAEVSSVHALLAGEARRSGLVARTVVEWPALGVVVGQAVTGRSLSHVLADPALPAAERMGVAAALGRRLAELHALDPGPAPERSASDQLTSLRRLVPAARCADDVLGGHLAETVDRLEPRTPPAIDRVLAHGGFRPGQAVRSDSGEVTLLDLDGACRGEAARDLGTALAHLTWQGVTQPSLRPALEAASSAFLAGYEAAAGRLDPAALTWWRAAALLQVAARRYRRLDVADWPLCPALIGMAARLIDQQLPGAPPADRPDCPALSTVTSPADSAGITPSSDDLLAPGRMTAALRPALAPVATHPERLAVVAAHRLSSAPGRRSVVRYLVTGLDGPEPVALVGKAYAQQEHARQTHHQLQALSDGPFRTGRMAVPRPVALLPELSLVLYRPGRGEPLDRITDPARALRGMREAARWLAALHDSDVRMRRRLDLGRETASTRQWADAVAGRHPDLREPAGRLAADWATGLQATSAGVEVPLHKDFHSGHVLLGAQVCVIDLDEARHGDRAFDVAHFTTYLAAAGDSEGTLAAAFVQEYAARTGRDGLARVDPGNGPDGGAVPAWTAYTWLKIAKQLTVGSGPWPSDHPVRERGPADAVERGLACLHP